MEAGRWSVIQTHRRVSPAPCSQRHLSNTTTANSSQFLSKKVFILMKKNPKFDFTFIIIKIWLYILNCSFLLLVCPQAAITSLSGSHHFLFFLVYVRYLIPSSPLYFVHVRQHGGHSRRGCSQEWTQQVEQVPADLHLPHVWSKEHHLQQAELVGTRHMQSHVNLIGQVVMVIFGLFKSP